MNENNQPEESKSLDLSPSGFDDLLKSAHQLVTSFYQGVGSQQGFHSYPQQEVESWFDEPLPMEPMDMSRLMGEIQTHVMDPATGNAGPNMYGYVMAGGNQVSSVADFLAATVNQNATKWHLGPSMTEIEKRVVKWAAEMIGYTPDAGGVMVSGGSGANLAGLTVARNTHFRQSEIRSKGLFGMKPFTVYCSTETHNCVDKSVAELGIGTDQLRRIPAGKDFRADVNAIEEQIKTDLTNGFTPFCVVGNAGTVNTGAVDDLEALAALAKQYGLWFHVDGAYGGLAASIDALKPHFRGIEQADSIALDFHKWLYQPYEIGCVLVRDWSILREAYLKKAEYLDNSLQQHNVKPEFFRLHQWSPCLRWPG
ncbi:MAG: pyridoxal phosphate-dependent decarboxylase family protein [Bacteroidota bacterium]